MLRLLENPLLWVCVQKVKVSIMMQIVDDGTKSVPVEIASTSSLPHISRYRIATANEVDTGDVAVIDICCSPPSSPEALVPDESIWSGRATLVSEVPEYLQSTARLTIHDDSDTDFEGEDDDHDDDCEVVAQIDVADAMDTPRSVTLPTFSDRETVDLEDDLGFVDGDEDFTGGPCRSVTFVSEDTNTKGAQEKRQRHENHYEQERIKYKQRLEKMESMSKVTTRRQKFHRSFNFVRGRYQVTQTPVTKGPKLPASLCPPTRYGKEARVIETKERSKKKGTWSMPPKYPVKQRYKDVALDCQIMRYVEKSDLAVQCNPYKQDIAIQCPMSMTTSSTQYPRSRVKDNAIQVNGFGKVDAAVQNANTTRNVMVETCYKYICSSNTAPCENKTIDMCGDKLDDKQQQCKKPDVCDATMHERKASLADSTQAGSQSERSDFSDENDSDGAQGPRFKCSEDTRRRTPEILGLRDDEDEYSSDWDSGDA